MLLIFNKDTFKQVGWKEFNSSDDGLIDVGDDIITWNIVDWIPIKIINENNLPWIENEMKLELEDDIYILNTVPESEIYLRKLIKFKENAIESGKILISKKNDKLAGNRNIGFLIEKARIARTIIKNKAESDDIDDFKAEAKLRNKGEDYHTLANKSKRKCKRMLKRMFKLDRFYDRFIDDVNNCLSLEDCESTFELFKSDVKEKVRR